MIRASDLSGANASLWARPAVAPVRSEARDASAWFGAATDIRVSGDLSATARGLSVDQHAAQVLAHLCAEPDATT